MDEFDREKKRLMDEYEKARKAAHGYISQLEDENEQAGKEAYSGFIVKDLPPPPPPPPRPKDMRDEFADMLDDLGDPDQEDMIKAEIVAMSTAAMQGLMSNPKYVAESSVSRQAVHHAISLMLELRRNGVV